MEGTIHYATAAAAVPQTAPAANSEALLIQRAQGGDQIAFYEIVEQYKSRVFSIIHRMLRDRSEAEDVAQEVFASAFFSIRRYKQQGSLMSWLYRITVNECYEHLRKKKARPLVYEGEISTEWKHVLESRNPVPAADTEASGRDFAVKLLANVPKRDRALLFMKEVEGYSLQELADMAGLSEGALRLRLFRARKRLLKLGKPALARAAHA